MTAHLRPSIRVNKISALSNEGTVRFMTSKGMRNTATFLEFVQRLVAGARRKILLIADGLHAQDAGVEAWLEEYKDQIEVFYLPA